MKYWNKSKKYRETWTKVDGPSHWKSEEAKRWCQLNGSSNRFFFRLDFPLAIMSISRDFYWPWYFENAQDATAFRLVWSSGNRKTTS